MTDKQIEKLGDSLRGKMFKDMTKEERTLYDELSCRGMINSCLIYGTARYNFYDPATGIFAYYAHDHIERLGKDEVIRLYNEQVEDFKKAVVIRNVYTDSEGCTYNSCKWADD